MAPQFSIETANLLFVDCIQHHKLQLGSSQIWSLTANISWQKRAKVLCPENNVFPFMIYLQQSDMFLIPVTKHYALQNFRDCAFNKNAIKE